MGLLSISKGNRKMGGIQSVSLPSVLTCRKCACQTKCYARRLERIRPAVANAYRRNLEVLQSNPGTYWREVEATITLSRFFRFHVSGDIPDADYFTHMIDVAKRNTHCEILCFTKKYEIVNEYVASGGILPRNLHIVFSVWVGLKMSNPFLFPAAHVRFRDGFTTAPAGAVECRELYRMCDNRRRMLVFNERLARRFQRALRRSLWQIFTSRTHILVTQTSFV